MDDIPDDIAKIYERLSSSIPIDDFVEKVRQKVDSMAGLCDEKTAAMLVAHELGADLSVKILEIDTQRRHVAFIGKIEKISPLREFKRNDDVGYVTNIVVSDETGSIRVVLWDDLARHAEELQIGQLLKISGLVKDGLYGIEVNARDVQVDDSEVSVHATKRPDIKKIADLVPRSYDVDLTGIVLEIGPVRTFSRQDGTTGKVTSLTLGDETGKIRVALWDERAERAVDFKPGDVLRIEHGYTKESYGRLEVHVGNRGTVETSAEHVEFRDDITHIKDLGLDVPCTIEGVLDSVGSLREFTRSDGRIGKVRSVVVKDKTGEVRVVFWGDKAEAIREEDGGRRILIRDGIPRSGFIDQVELSVDWRSGICFVDARPEQRHQVEIPAEVEDVRITGTVISSNSNICVDNGVDYVVFEKNAIESDLDIGDEVVVTGEWVGTAFKVTNISKLGIDFEKDRLERVKTKLTNFRRSSG